MPYRVTDEGKRPEYDRATLAHGCYSATNDTRILDAWAARWPAATWGAVPPDGPDADGYYAYVVDPDALGSRAVLESIGMPTECWVSSGRNKEAGHSYFLSRVPLPTKMYGPAGFGDPTDGRAGAVMGETIRPAGHMAAILPGSVHPSGRVYSASPEWLEWAAGRRDLPLAPDSFGETLSAWSEKPARASEQFDVADIVPGTATAYVAAILRDESAALAAMVPESGRNPALFRSAARLGSFALAGGLAFADAEAALLTACRSNGALDDHGLRKCRDTIARGWTAGQAAPKAPPRNRETPPDVADLLALCASASAFRAAVPLDADGRRPAGWRGIQRTLYAVAAHAAARGACEVHGGYARYAKASGCGRKAAARRLRAAAAWGWIELDASGAGRGPDGTLRAVTIRLNRTMGHRLYVGETRTSGDSPSEGHHGGATMGHRAFNSPETAPEPAWTAQNADVALHPAAVGPRLYLRIGPTDRPALDVLLRENGADALADRIAADAERYRGAETLTRIGRADAETVRAHGYDVTVKRSELGRVYAAMTGDYGERLDAERHLARGDTGAAVAYVLATLGASGDALDVMTIADAAGCSVDTARRHLAALEAHNLAACATDAPSGRGRPRALWYAEADLADMLAAGGELSAAWSAKADRETEAMRRRAAGPAPELEADRIPADVDRAAMRGKARAGAMRRRLDATRQWFETLAYVMGAHDGPMIMQPRGAGP